MRDQDSAREVALADARRPYNLPRSRQMHKLRLIWPQSSVASPGMATVLCRLSQLSQGGCQCNSSRQPSLKVFWQQRSFLEPHRTAVPSWSDLMSWNSTGRSIYELHRARQARPAESIAMTSGNRSSAHASSYQSKRRLLALRRWGSLSIEAVESLPRLFAGNIASLYAFRQVARAGVP